ncbi:MAG: peptidoglycan-binding domain-containing protein [Luteibacter sp.]
MTDIDTHDVNAVAGATYFVVGRGTEGGPSSYHLSITGVTVGTSDPHWGTAGSIVADSGYTLGTIQVDLGKRGTWALGATDGATPKSGETTYVDGIIDQASKYAKDHDLKFAGDTAKLRSDLLSHGNGKDGRDTLSFIDKDTRDSINAWAGSEDGQKWIHKNIDYPQIKNATQSSMDLLDKYGKNIPEEHRLETIAILAKTENQIPSQMAKFEKVLKDGGNYDDVLARANHIKHTYPYYDGPKAAAIAEEYKNAHKDPERAAALDRANAKVGDPDFNPKASANDADIKDALKAIGQGGRSHAAHGGALRQGTHGDDVTAVQNQLVKLGYTDAHDRALTPDGDFGTATKAAVEKFQHDHGMKADGVVGPKTLDALNNAAQRAPSSLTDPASPGNAMYKQALDAVSAIDAQHGRTPDALTRNFAGSVVTAAQAQGLTKVDHVVMSDDRKHAYAVQGELNSPFKKMAEVDVARAVATPLGQSSANYQAAQQMQQQVPPQQQQQPAVTQAQAEPQAMQR